MRWLFFQSLQESYLAHSKPYRSSVFTTCTDWLSPSWWHYSQSTLSSRHLSYWILTRCQVRQPFHRNTITISGFSETTILLGTLVLSSSFTGANVFIELTVKLWTGRPHLGHVPFFIFMGAEKKNVNMTEPWFLTSSLFSVGFCALAMLVYKILKSR